MRLKVLQDGGAPPGVEVWRGPSRLDPSAELVVVATGIGRASANPKTGAMVQVWILHATEHPVAAVRTGADAAMCGDCGARGGDGVGRWCYVAVGRAPAAVWSAWRDGRYPRVPASRVAGLSRGRPVRLGAYGDPAAIPLRVCRDLVRGASSWTGYTRQWRRRPGLRSLVMASCHDPAELGDARRLGWRAFLVVPPDTPDPPAGSIWCPASPEGGYRSACDRCRLCSGADAAGTGRRGDGRAPDVAIRVHGGAATMNAARRAFG